MDDDIFKIADEIRILKELTITELASETNINRGNLNAWLNAGTPDRLSSDKIKKIFDYLKIDLDPLRLRPGIHRFTIPIPASNSVSLTESVIFKFFPEGGTFYPVWGKSFAVNIDQSEDANELLSSRIQWRRWVAVPKFTHDIRVIFKMGEKAKRIFRYKFLSAPFIFGVSGWHQAEKINLPDQVFSRLAHDESLTVTELDKILSYSPSSDYLWSGESIASDPGIDYGWTWSLILKKAKESGLTPREVAKRLGLSK